MNTIAPIATSIDDPVIAALAAHREAHQAMESASEAWCALEEELSTEVIHGAWIELGGRHVSHAPQIDGYFEGLGSATGASPDAFASPRATAHAELKKARERVEAIRAGCPAFHMTRDRYLAAHVAERNALELACSTVPRTSLGALALASFIRDFLVEGEHAEHVALAQKALTALASSLGAIELSPSNIYAGDRGDDGLLTLIEARGQALLEINSPEAGPDVDDHPAWSVVDRATLQITNRPFPRTTKGAAAALRLVHQEIRDEAATDVDRMILSLVDGAARFLEVRAV